MHPLKRELASVATRQAYRCRKRFGCTPWSPVSLIDSIEKLGIQVRFVDLSSVEGIYASTTPPVILIGAQRPIGRQNFTCCHELAHHILRHGTKCDQIQEIHMAKTKFEPEEFSADVFASNLLMPKAAVMRGFRLRNWDPMNPSPVEAYHIAQWLGVSYAALINHLRFTLRFLSFRSYNSLISPTPSLIKSEILGRQFKGEVIYVDENWVDRPVDCQIGDLLLVPMSLTVNGSRIGEILFTGQESQFLLTNTGLGRIYSNDESWASFIRVSRKGYCGLSQYRHLEDVKNE